MATADRTDEAQRVMAALVSAGWTVDATTATDGPFACLQWPGEPSRYLGVPRATNPDFAALMDSLIGSLMDTERLGKTATRALEALTEAGVIL